MLRELKYACVLVVAVIAAGCATGIRYQPQSAPDRPSDLATVYIYRSAVFGTAVQPAVRLDGERISTLRPRGYSVHYLEPGTYEVSAKTESTSRLTIHARPGEVLYVRGKIRMGFFVGRPKLELVTAEVAEEQLRKCKRLDRWSEVGPTAVETQH